MVRFIHEGIEYFSVVHITREQVRGHLPKDKEHLADDDGFIEDVVIDYANEFDNWTDGSLGSTIDLNVHTHKEAK